MNYIIEKEAYLNVLAAWKKTANHTAADHIIYNALRGFDIKRGFSPVVKPSKLSNGFTEWGAYNMAKAHAIASLREPDVTVSKWVSEEKRLARIDAVNKHLKKLGERFGIELTPELLQKLRETILQ